MSQNSTCSNTALKNGKSAAFVKIYCSIKDHKMPAIIEKKGNNFSVLVYLKLP
jgi:hypothetical protein